MMQFIPTHPSQNRHIDEGVYDAEIREIQERIYNLDSHLIHLLVWLPEEGHHYCTTFYFPNGCSVRSQQRLWHLCRAVDLELHQVIDEPEQFTGKSLRIKTYSVSPKSGRRYSDVELFLPAIRNASVQVLETVDEFCAENG